jgi:hypothetical protein
MRWSIGDEVRQLAIEMRNINKELNALGSKGIQFINKEHEYVEGAFVSFVHPRSRRGVLIKLLQSTPKPKT